MYFMVGLLLIIVGWIIQLGKVLIKNDTNVNPYFLVLYAVGVLFLVIGNFLAGDVASALLNLITAILSLILLVVLVKK